MSKFKFTEKQQIVLSFLQGNQGVNLTAVDIAEATNLTAPAVNATATSLARKDNGYIVRVEVEGMERKVIRLTEDGKTADVKQVIEE